MVLRSKTKEGTRSMLLKSSILTSLAAHRKLTALACKGKALDQALLKSSIRVVVLRSKTKEGTRSMRLYYLLLVKILQG